MPKLNAAGPKKPTSPEAVGATTEPLAHAHTWRTSYGPDGTSSKVCACGAVQTT